MNTTRLEAFSDGVIAIIITIMVLEFKIPHEADLAALRPLLPSFLTYLLSFIYLGIYWNNHHHMLHVTRKVNGRVLWANLHLLFWLSLVPFVTGWMGENHFESVPAAVYGVVMLGASFAWSVLQDRIMQQEGETSQLRANLGRDLKAKLSILAYVAAIPLAFLSPWLSIGLYATVAVAWIDPDRRITARD